jgi:hypothetical protein
MLRNLLALMLAGLARGVPAAVTQTNLVRNGDFAQEAEADGGTDCDRPMEMRR